MAPAAAVGAWTTPPLPLAIQAPPPYAYDCTDHYTSSWDAGRRDWCCEHQGVACSSATAPVDAGAAGSFVGQPYVQAVATAVATVEVVETSALITRKDNVIVEMHA